MTKVKRWCNIAAQVWIVCCLQGGSGSNLCDGNLKRKEELSLSLATGTVVSPKRDIQNYATVPFEECRQYSSFPPDFSEMRIGETDDAHNTSISI